MYRIYYEDDSIYDGHLPRIDHLGDTDDVDLRSFHVLEAPPLKMVVAIVQSKAEPELEVLTGKEYYYWKGEHWVGTDLWHVLAYFEDELDFIRYRGGKRKIYSKARRKWNNAAESELYEAIENSGLVLLGTSESPERVLEILTRAMDEADSGIIPDTVRIPSGLRLRVDTRR